MYSSGFEKMVRDNLNIKVYLKSNLTEPQRNALEKNIAGKDFVAKTPTPIEFVSKDEAEKALVGEVGEFREIMGENPLKDAFVVRIDPSTITTPPNSLRSRRNSKKPEVYTKSLMKLPCSMQ